ncbi:hypothetical protein [Candidatus Villigracilis affinis]|nr:hypothetical protein [Anaerolineales bacterium]
MNDALFALAKIGGRFREDSNRSGNTLTDKFYNDEFDVPPTPFGVD